MLSRFLLFLVLAAGALVHAWNTATESGFIGGTDVMIGPGRFRLDDSVVVTGYAYLGDLAVFLKDELPEDGSVITLSEQVEPAFWLSYLAYPRLVEYIPFLNAEYRFKRLQRGRHFVAVIPPTPMPPRIRDVWKEDRLRARLKSLLGGGQIKNIYQSASGLAVFEVTK